MKKNPFHNKKIVIIYLFVLVALGLGITYALQSNSMALGLTTALISIDETAYGSTTFDASDLELQPILDTEVETKTDNVVKIDFTVGGAETNNNDNIIYDIALVDLEANCDLLSPYIKWKLVKDGEDISSGSLDYKFDTIVDGRLVLTEIQQDLPDYNANATGYHDYSFYLWVSDSCQDDLTTCMSNNQLVDQSSLLNKSLSGKIEVELYTESKKALERNPESTLKTSYCVNKVLVEYDTSGGSTHDAELIFDNENGVKTYPTLPTPTRSYTVTYDTGGGTEVADQTIDYTFNGWYSDKNYTTVVNSGDEMSITKNHTLYAKWSGDNVITLPTSTREGYDFQGWYSDSNYKTKIGDAGDSYQVFKDVTLYAKWKGSIYTVTYNSGNLFYDIEETPTISDVGLEYSIDSGGTVTATSFVEDGYTFTTGRVYLMAGTTYTFSCTTNGTWGGSGDTVEGFLMLDGEYNTYYWLSNGGTITPTVSGEYWLRFDVNTAGKTYTFSDIKISYTVGTQSYNYGSTYGTLQTLSMTNNNFNGWYTENSGGTQITDSTTLVSASDHTIYGQWTAKTYSIGSTYYATLADAIAGASAGSEIKLLRNYSDGSTATVGKNLTFNNNGYTLTKTKVITVNSGSTLTVSGSGTMQTGDNQLIYNNGTLNITHTGTIQQTLTAPSNATLIQNTGTLNKTGAGTIKSYNYVLYGGTINIVAGTVQSLANSDENKPAEQRGVGGATSITVSGGTVTGATYGIVGASSGTITVSGGLVSGSYGICPMSGTLNITGGTVSGTNCGVVMWNGHTGTVTVGSSTATFSTTTPLVYGGVYSPSGSTFNFYNGVIKFPTSPTYTAAGTANYRSGFTVYTTPSKGTDGLYSSTLGLTVTIASGNTSYGTVSASSVVVPYNATYSGATTGTLTIKNSSGTTLNTITANPTSATGYNTSFSSWSPSSGTITAATTITANFSRSRNFSCSAVGSTTTYAGKSWTTIAKDSTYCTLAANFQSNITGTYTAATTNLNNSFFTSSGSDYNATMLTEKNAGLLVTVSGSNYIDTDGGATYSPPAGIYWVGSETIYDSSARDNYYCTKESNKYYSLKVATGSETLLPPYVNHCYSVTNEPYAAGTRTYANGYSTFSYGTYETKYDTTSDSYSSFYSDFWTTDVSETPTSSKLKMDRQGSEGGLYEYYNKFQLRIYPCGGQTGEETRYLRFRAVSATQYEYYYSTTGTSANRNYSTLYDYMVAGSGSHTDFTFSSTGNYAGKTGYDLIFYETDTCKANSDLPYYVINSESPALHYRARIKVKL